MAGGQKQKAIRPGADGFLKRCEEQELSVVLQLAAAQFRLQTGNGAAGLAELHRILQLGYGMLEGKAAKGLLFVLQFIFQLVGRQFFDISLFHNPSFFSV